jgi:hypothetical protein
MATNDIKMAKSPKIHSQNQTKVLVSSLTQSKLVHNTTKLWDMQFHFIISLEIIFPTSYKAFNLGMIFLFKWHFECA